jgi:hypothetical protein
MIMVMEKSKKERLQGGERKGRRKNVACARSVEWRGGVVA